MSSQKGNNVRNRPQKHQNSVAFKNTLHDTNHRTKAINNTTIQNVCVHCKEVIVWKIKYKKYKPLSQAKTCVRCNQKAVKQAYHIMCAGCARTQNACAKCGTLNAAICPPDIKADEIELTSEMKNTLKSMSERKRRTFNRFIEKKKSEAIQKPTTEDVMQEIVDKLKSLTAENDCDLDFTDDEDEHNDI